MLLCMVMVAVGACVCGEAGWEAREAQPGLKQLEAEEELEQGLKQLEAAGKRGRCSNRSLCLRNR